MVKENKIMYSKLENTEKTSLLKIDSKSTQNCSFFFGNFERFYESYIINIVTIYFSINMWKLDRIQKMRGGVFCFFKKVLNNKKKNFSKVAKKYSLWQHIDFSKKNQKKTNLLKIPSHNPHETTFSAFFEKIQKKYQCIIIIANHKCRNYHNSNYSNLSYI